LKDLKEITKNPRTLITCTRIGRSLGLCPNIFSSSSSSTTSFLDEDLIRQGITSDDEQVFSFDLIEKKREMFFLSKICLDCLFTYISNSRQQHKRSPLKFGHV